VSLKEKIMKKFTLYIMTVWFILMATCSINYADEDKTAALSEKGQSTVNADSNQYIIGPEDVLLIYVWKEESITRTVPVRIDGKISLPLIDDIQAADLTPLELKKALTEKLKGFVANPTVTVTVMEANSYKAYVSGEVKSPGVFRIRDGMTLVKLIIAVGGFTEWANKKNILIITKEKDVEKRITANYKKIIAGDEPDIIINRGDTVIVK
jgi:polysaccharide export outer membrane protein